MNNFAVVKLGSSQQKVSVGELVVTDRINKEIGEKVTVSDVLMVADGENITVGTPTLDTNVVFEVVSHTKGKKVKIHKFKAKSRYKKTTGFRAFLTTLKVVSIGNAKAENKEKAVKPAKKPAAKATKAK